MAHFKNTIKESRENYRKKLLPLQLDMEQNWRLKVNPVKTNRRQFNILFPLVMNVNETYSILLDRSATLQIFSMTIEYIKMRVAPTCSGM